jgi:hypothetical protein
MAKQPWHKDRIHKIKNSPAVETWKESSSLGDFIDKSLDYISPKSNKHRDTGRSSHFEGARHNSTCSVGNCATCAINQMRG